MGRPHWAQNWGLLFRSTPLHYVPVSPKSSLARHPKPDCNGVLRWTLGARTVLTTCDGCGALVEWKPVLREEQNVIDWEAE